MKTIAHMILLVCACLWSVKGVITRTCDDIPAYRYLNDFVQNDKCESVDLVFKYLHDMTEQWGNGQCRINTINNLANHFGTHAHTPDHCQCNGTFKLQVYSTSPTDGIHSDLANYCLQNDKAYKEVYNQFFPSQSQHQDLVCRTHHSLWSHLRDTNANNGCQKDVVYHLSYAFSQHGDPCTCYDVASTISTTTTTTTTTITEKATTPTTPHSTGTVAQNAVSSQNARNKYEVIERILNPVHVTHPDGTPCDLNAGGSDDAYTIVACHMPPPRTWLKGSNMAIQKCNGVPTIIQVANGILINNPDNYYVIA